MNGDLQPLRIGSGLVAAGLCVVGCNGPSTIGSTALSDPPPVANPSGQAAGSGGQSGAAWGGGSGEAEARATPGPASGVAGTVTVEDAGGASASGHDLAPSRPLNVSAPADRYEHSFQASYRGVP